MRWGYECCWQFVKNSYCVGDALKCPPANNDKAEAYKAGQAQMLITSESMKESDGNAFSQDNVKARMEEPASRELKIEEKERKKIEIKR